MNDNSYKVIEVDINEILPNRFQPRIQFDEQEILELSDSIKEHGVIQPLVVRTIGDKYEIIAGERRYKASVLAGKETVPVIIKNLNDKDSAEIALIENIQRKNLTPIEEALSYKKILDMGYITQENLATKLGKSQSSVANKIRLLNLSDEVQEALLDNKISERHARSLLRIKSSKEQNEMLNKIISQRLTVRKTDEEIDKLLNLTNTLEKEIKEEKGEEKMNNEFNQIPNVVTPQQSTTFDIFGGTSVVPSTSTPVAEVPAVEAAMPSMAASEPTMAQMPTMEFGMGTPVNTPVAEAPAVEAAMPSMAASEPTMDQMPTMEFGTGTPVNTSVAETPVMEAAAMSSMAAPEPTMAQMPTMEFGMSAPVSTPVAEAPAVETQNIPATSPIIESAPIANDSLNTLTSPTLESTITQPISSNEEPQTISEFKMPDPIIVTDYTKQYDPVMPTSTVTVPSKEDFKEVISAIRECTEKIEKYGYKIDVEEYDLSTLYQVVFKIEK